MNFKINRDKLFRAILYGSAFFLIVLIFGFFITFILESSESLTKFGFGFITGKQWDPVDGHFGALPFLSGTLITSFLGLIISFPISLMIAVFLSEYFYKGFFHNVIKTAVELLAGIPSIVFGFWGLFALVPLIREFQLSIGIEPYGVGIFTSAIVLSIMIIPYTASISREVISMVPTDVKEAAYSLGATKFEVIRKIILPYSGSGIFAGALLALGRALGETMAVTMIIGNSNSMPTSIFSPGNTMASVIANEFTEATDSTYVSALIEIGLLLFLVTALINLVGKYIIKKTVQF